MRIDLTVAGPDGEHRDVAVLARPGTRWAEVRPLLAPQAWWSGVRRLADDDVLGGGGLRDGALLTTGPCRDGVPVSGHRLDVVGGPDAGASVALGREPVTVGRAPGCELVLADPRVSRVHAQVSLTTRGGTVSDRGSAGGSYVEQVRLTDGAALPVPPGALVRVGDTFLRIAARLGTSATSTETAAPPGAGAELELPEPPQPAPAARLQLAAAVLPAALGAGLALTMHSAQFLLFALLAPVALLGSAAGDRLHHRRVRGRSRRQYRHRLADTQTRITGLLAGEVSARRSAHPDPVSVLSAAQLAGPRLWRRPAEAADMLSVRLGLADLPSRLTVRDRGRSRPAGTAGAVPVCVDLGHGPLGIAGPAPIAVGTARWVVGQLTTRAGPAAVGLRLLLSPDTESDWRWARWLPHLDAVAVTRHQQAEMVAELCALRDLRAAQSGGTPPEGRRIVLVLDGRSAAELPGLSELLADGARVGISAIAVDRRGAGLPTGCVATATAAGDTGSCLDVRTAAATARPVADRVSPAWAEQLARALAPLHEPDRGATALASRCSLLDLLGLPTPTPEQLLRRWRDSDGTLGTVLGRSPDGPVRLDLVQDGPHALVAGTTGSGKSELLRALVAGLAANHPPDAVGFVLVDYKGGAAFADCATLPHTAGLVTDLDAHLAARALQSLECELHRRERLFADSDARDLTGYRRTNPAEPLARLVIVVDEFAELAAELPEFVSGLVGIARRGRSLGVHLVLATQRPAGVVSAEIRANTAVRIALRVTDAGDSQDVIDAVDAATIDRRWPGRAYLRLPGGAPILLQTALAGEPAPITDGAPRVVDLDGWRRPRDAPSGTASATALHRLAAALSEAAQHADARPARRPWLEPLPATVPVATLTTSVPAVGRTAADQGLVPLGLLDLPSEQRRATLAVDVHRGDTVLFAGGPRSGRTSALRTLAVSAANRLGPGRLQLHVADHAGGGLAGLAELPHCGSLVVDDLATTHRLLARLGDEVARRRSGGANTERAPALLILLDGWEQFLAAAEQHDAPGAVELLLGLLRSGPSVGVTVALAGDRGALNTRLCSAVVTKLALRLTDRADYALLGIAERSVPSELPPGRAVRAEDGAELQLAHLGAAPSERAAADAIAATAALWPVGAAPDPGPLIRVRPLPASVRLSSLGRAVPPEAVHRCSSPHAPVVLGAGGDAAEPLVADLFAGRARLLVAGPPGSGRSTLLLVLLEQLREQPHELIVAAPDRSPLVVAARAAGIRVYLPGDAPAPIHDRPAVLLVDDAEAFGDRPAGDQLTAWAQSRTDVAVVAAGCSDELAVAFRGIAAYVRKARCAVLLDPGPADGDLVGVRLARRRPGGPPGRGVLVGDPAWGLPFGPGPVPIQLAQPG